MSGPASSRVFIAGWCEQGRSAVRHYSGKAAMTVVADTRPSDLPPGVDFSYLSDTQDVTVAASDLVLRCPPLHPARVRQWLNSTSADAAPAVTSATQLFLENRGADKVIGVTGTKGKSTTSALIAHVLRRVSTCELAGNCGISPLDIYDTAAAWVVLELANFQTMDLTVAPRYVVLRPIGADHLDWHSSLDEYVDAKRQLIRSQASDGIVVADREDPRSQEVAAVCAGQILVAGTNPVGHTGPRRIRVREVETADLSEHALPGVHGMSNALAGAQLLDALGLEPHAIADGLETFPGLPHRLESLPAIGSVRVINDSHSTAPMSTAAAVRAVKGPLVLLVGGRMKQADLGPIAEVVADADVRTCITFGEDGPRVAQVLTRGGFAVREAAADASMEELLRIALGCARAGDCILLSPAGASTDQFIDAAARGDAFRVAAAAATAGS